MTIPPIYINRLLSRGQPRFPSQGTPYHALHEAECSGRWTRLEAVGRSGVERDMMWKSWLSY